MIDYHSYHIFVFPFKWELNKRRNKNFSAKTDLQALSVLFGEHNYNWQKTHFSFRDNDDPTKASFRNYNEYQYFYDFVRPALYEFNKTLFLHHLRPGNEKASQLLSHYQFKKQDYGDLIYRIRKNKSPSEKNKPEYKEQLPPECRDEAIRYAEYDLDIDDIFVNFYDSGVGIITFHLRNTRYDSPQSILNINQYGRRISPPFLGETETLATGATALGIDATKEAELASLISIKSLDNKNLKRPLLLEESFEGYPRSEEATEADELERAPFRLPDFISGLFANDFLFSESRKQVGHVYLEPAIDDRMFVICWYGCKKEYWNRYINGEKINLEAAKNQRTLRVAKEPGKKTILTVEETEDRWLLDSEFWYKFLFVDAGFKTCQNTEMSDTLLERQTYRRWSNWNTFFGVSRYSFVCLTEPLPDLRNNFASFLPVHVRTIYYKMVELSIVQRASILKFSDEVTQLSSQLNHINARFTNDMNALYEAYILFINKIYFREVTAQEQGIELYNLLQRELDVERQVKDLDEELNELHQFISFADERKNSRQLDRLTVLGALFLVPTFVISFYAMGILPESYEQNNALTGWVLVNIAVLSVITYLYVLILRRGKSIYAWIMLAILIISILAALAIPIFQMQGNESFFDFNNLTEPADVTKQCL